MDVMFKYSTSCVPTIVLVEDSSLPGIGNLNYELVVI